MARTPFKLLLAVLLTTTSTPVRAGATDASDAPPGPAGQPVIATPAPDASPKKVEQAKEVAKTAELTPIVPSPRDATRPAFQLYAEVDAPILTVGLVFAAGRLVKKQPAYCAPLCDPTELNRLDRLTAGYYNPTWSTASDVGLAVVAVGAVTLLVVDEGGWAALNDSVVVAEAALTSVALASMMTLAAGRPRPYMFGENAPLEHRMSPDGGLSFLSSHTSMAFAITTSLYVAERRLHPHSNGPHWVLGVGLAVSTVIATSRVMSGNHFITDVLGGAAVGSSVGVLTASLHASPVTVVPVVGDRGQTGLGIHGSF